MVFFVQTFVQVQTSIEMIPLCFSSIRSQMILLLKNCTGSHWSQIIKKIANTSQ